MRLFNKLFTKQPSLKECPRCLGKGHVDWDDIKRLNKELKWVPGSCAYCNGVGKVDAKIEEDVPVDTTYLVNSLPEEERQKLVSGHPEALERACQYDEQLDEFINGISYLYFETNLQPVQIARFYLLHSQESESYENELQEMIEYVEKVIQVKRSKY